MAALGSPCLSGSADVRLLLLRRHVLEHIVPVQRSLADRPWMGFCGIRTLHQRIFSSLRIRRAHSLRHAARQVGRPHHRIHLCGTDDRGSGTCTLGYNIGTHSKTVAHGCIHWLYAIRAGQRDCRRGGYAQHSPLVQGRPHGLRDGAAARNRTSGNGVRTRDGAKAGAGKNLPGGIHSGGNIQAGYARPCTSAARMYSLGRFRGFGCETLPLRKG